METFWFFSATIFIMMRKKFLIGFVIGLSIGLATMGVYASYRFGDVAYDLNMLKDMNQSKLRQIEHLTVENSRLKSELYRMMPSVLTQEQRDAYLLASEKIAANFTSFKGEVINYKNDELGFKMSYPAAWGELKLEIRTPEKNPGLVLKGKEAIGIFEKFGVYFDAKSPDYEDPGHGLNVAESIFYTKNPEEGDPARDHPKPDVVRVLGTDQKVFIWYAWPVGWETHQTSFGFKAPLEHPDFHAISAAGPISNEPLTTEAIEGFLEMAKTFELLKL